MHISLDFMSYSSKMRFQLLVLSTLLVLLIVGPEMSWCRPPRNNTRLCDKNPTIECDCIKMKMTECKELHHERIDAR